MPQILPRSAGHEADIPPLHTISPRGREIIAAYLEPEIAYAFERGWQACEDHYGRLHTVSADVARTVADRGSFADLAERRGQHDRATRQRAVLRERGIA